MRDISPAVMAAESDLQFWFLHLLIPAPNPFTWADRQGEEATNSTIYTPNSGSCWIGAKHALLPNEAY